MDSERASGAESADADHLVGTVVGDFVRKFLSTEHGLRRRTRDLPHSSRCQIHGTMRKRTSSPCFLAVALGEGKQIDSVVPDKTA